MPSLGADNSQSGRKKKENDEGIFLSLMLLI